MRIHSHRRGSGPPLLLLHPIGMSWRVWEPILGLLGRSRSVVAIDLPGFGESASLPAPTVPALADAIADWAGDGMDVAGCSLGGGIALELARQGWASSACVFSPIGFYSDWDLRYLRASLSVSRYCAERFPFRALRSGIGRRVAFRQGGPARGERLSFEAAAGLTRDVALAPGWHATLESAIGWRWPGGEVGVPVTVAWGTRDRLLPPRQASRARAALPEARHVSLEGCGHIPFADDPEQTAHMILTTPRT